MNSVDPLRAAYDARADERNRWPSENWKLALVESLLQRLGPAPLVLDLGSGPGLLAEHMRAKGARAVAADLSPRHVELCQARGLEARLLDFRVDQIGDATFDGILAMNSLLHVPRSELGPVIDNIARALRPNGVAMAVQWGGESFEGSFPEDSHRPARHFSLWSDDDFYAYRHPAVEIVDRFLVDETTAHGHHPQVLVFVRAGREVSLPGSDTG